MTIVDNFLSSDPVNVPDDPAVKLVSGSITDERILRELDDDLDYVYHLACFHGNQSSIYDPLADHDNNTLTTLKLFERLKDIKSLKKVVYSAAGCAVAEKTFDGATATTEEAAVSLFHDSPYSISKLIGEMYGNYYFTRYGLPFVKARFQNVYGPGEILGAGPLAWHSPYCLAQRDADLYLEVIAWRSVASRKRRDRQPRFHFCGRYGARSDGLRAEGVAWRDLQSGFGCGDHHQAACRTYQC